MTKSVIQLGVFFLRFYDPDDHEKYTDIPLGDKDIRKEIATCFFRQLMNEFSHGEVADLHLPTLWLMTEEGPKQIKDSLN